MISFFRRHLNSWPVRAFFLLLVAAFALWGVRGIGRNMGQTGNELASVGGQTVTLQQATVAYHNGLAQVSRQMGNADPSPDIKRSVALQAVNRLVTQAALDDYGAHLGLAVPDSAIRAAVDEVPAFKGPDGKYDAATAREALRANHLTERDLADLVRSDVLDRQLLETARAGVGASGVLSEAVFRYQGEKRSADLVELPFSAAPAALPTDAQLHRWYDLHPDLYSTPEFRRIKAVILSPETVAKEIDISDDALHAAYDQSRAQFVQPEKRSAQIVTWPDEAPARALAATWRGGADWARIQADATKTGGAPIQLDDSTRAEFPGDALANAVFTATPDTIPAPVHDDLGWHVIRVTKVTAPSERSFDQARDELRARLAAEQAQSSLYERANKLDNLLASGASLDEMPSDLGLGSALGTLDAKGDTADGTPAPIPGPPSLRAAIVAAAFQAKVGEPPHLAEVPTPENGGQAYYALTVESQTPPVAQPFDEVRARVTEDWIRDAMRHAQDARAAKILADVQGGQSLADAATVAGVPVRRTAPTDRAKPAEGVPQNLVAPLFTLKPGEATMIETPDSFIVAVLADVSAPDPKSDPAGYAQIQSGITRAVGNDVELAFEQAVRERARPRVNQQLVEQMVGP